MKTDLKVELFLIHQTYFTDNHGNRSLCNGAAGNKTGLAGVWEIVTCGFYLIGYLVTKKIFSDREGILIFLWN
jgi:hypothetical protein